MNEEFGGDLVTIIDDEGNEFELEVLDRMDYNGSSYTLFLPADMKEDDPDYGYILLREIMDDSGEISFESIDDDDELQDVYERFMVFLFSDDEEDTDEDV